MKRHSEAEAAKELEAASRGWAEAGGSRPHVANESRDGLEFEAVYEQHFEFIWRTLRVLGVERESLDDGTQDVFGVVARQLGSFQGRSSLRTWLFGIAQNVASNHRRWRARKRDALEPIGDNLVSREPGPHVRAEHKETVDVMLRFCAELDDGRRAVFVLALVEGIGAAEIAASLGLPLNTVYSRIHALRKELKSCIERREVET